MATLLGIQTEYAYQLQDVGSLLEQVNTSPSTDVRDRAIVAAIAYYTRRLPRVQVALVSSIAGGFYPVPSDWVDHSRIIVIEYPLNLAPVPAYSSGRDVMIQPREGGSLYYVPNPNPGGQFRLVYTAAHGGTNPNAICGSIPTDHEGVVGMMAAARAMREYADRCAGMAASNIDSVDYRSKSKEYTDAAKALEDRVDLELSRSELAFQKKTSEEAYIRGWK